MIASREIELTEVNSEVEQARQLADKAKRDVERGERLYQDQVISLEQLQDLRTQASVAQAQLKGAEFNRGYAVITAPGDGVVLRKLSEERELAPAGQNCAHPRHEGSRLRRSRGALRS